MAKHNFHLSPLSGGTGDSDADCASSQLAMKRVASNASDRKRQKDEDLRYQTTEANTGSTNAGLFARKSTKKKKDY